MCDSTRNSNKGRLCGANRAQQFMGTYNRTKRKSAAREREVWRPGFNLDTLREIARIHASAASVRHYNCTFTLFYRKWSSVGFQGKVTRPYAGCNYSINLSQLIQRVCIVRNTNWKSIYSRRKNLFATGNDFYRGNQRSPNQKMLWNLTIYWDISESPEIDKSFCSISLFINFGKCKRNLCIVINPHNAESSYINCKYIYIYGMSYIYNL